jgi:hypothetical protein
MFTNLVKNRTSFLSCAGFLADTVDWQDPNFCQPGISFQKWIFLILYFILGRELKKNTDNNE